MTGVLSASAPEPAARAGMYEKRHDRPLTVLQVLPRLDSGGVERGSIEIAQAIVEAGGRALVASAGGRLTKRLESVGGEAVQMPLASKNPFRIKANAKRLVELIQNEGVHIVHARSRAPAWSAKWAAQEAGAYFITTYHGVYSEGMPFKRRYNSVMASGDVVIAISNFIAELVVKRHRVPPERVVTIPRGADLAAFSDEAVPAARVVALMTRWGIADDPRPVILMPGRLTRWKGQTLFIEALALLKKRIGLRAFSALIVGDEAKGGRFEAELARMIREAGLENTARIVGHCDDMPAAYKLASVTVSASLEPEAFGRVAVESQAMGAPVVASAHGGALETVLDGETGYLFEPGSVEALAEALAQFLEMPPAFRELMCEAAVRHVRRNFNTERMQTKTLELYTAVAGRTFKPMDF